MGLGADDGVARRRYSRCGQKEFVHHVILQRVIVTDEGSRVYQYWNRFCPRLWRPMGSMDLKSLYLARTAKVQMRMGGEKAQQSGNELDLIHIVRHGQT
mmetsp:Transcript_26848/g.57788  ORF Transcript_26848/g.57788 Transcript_26848/m.57788 type:complete len:99 (-) Transcript_26848:2-298(-)